MSSERVSKIQVQLYWPRISCLIRTNYFASQLLKFFLGDTAQFDDQSFKILGRSSVDILKSGGYKISALHVERLLLEHPQIADVAVLGISDEVYGQKVGVVIVLDKGVEDFTLEKVFVVL